MEEFQLGDVAVLEFVYKDVLKALLELEPARGVVFQERYRFGDEAVDGHGALAAQDFLAGAIGACDFLLQSDVLGALLAGVFVERAFVGFEFGRKRISEGLVVGTGTWFLLPPRE